MTHTIVELSADEQQKKMYNKEMGQSEYADVAVAMKYATVLLALAPTVTQPDDYGVMQDAMKLIAGIDDVVMLVDTHGTPASIPANHKLVIVADVRIRIDEIPAP